MDIKLFVDAFECALTIPKNEDGHLPRRLEAGSTEKAGAALRRGMIMKILLSTLALALAMGGQVEAQVVRPAPTGSSKDQAWSNMVIYAMRQSAQAHNGVAEYEGDALLLQMVCANSIALLR